MPTIWQIRFGEISPSLVRPTGVHRLLSAWVGDNEAEHQAPKPYSLAPIQADADTGVVVVTVKCLTDLMASALSDLPVGQEVKFGTTYPRVARIAAPATCVRQTSWEQITNTPASRGWRISFDSPLAIRRGDYDQPWPEPYTLLRRLEERWALFGPTVDGSVFSEVHARHLMVTGADLRTVASDAPGPGKELWGVEGLVEWLYPVADGGADVIHRLLLFSEYAGMGARTEYGLGSVSVSEMAGDVRSLFRARRHAAVQSLSESRHEARSNLRHLAKKGA